MKFVHIADVHLGMSFQHAGFGGKIGKERRQEIKATLMRVVTYCENHEVELLLIAGDLFEDTYVRLSELKDINHSFSKLSQTQVLISGGNHDPIIDNNSPYRAIDWHSNVHIFETSMSSIYLENINTQVWSFSWSEKWMSPFSIDPSMSLDSHRINLLMLHGDVYQKNNYHYIDKDELGCMSFDYIALGHIHKADFITPTMAYPGSLEPQDFSEVGDHGFIEGEISDGLCKAQFIPFSKRSFRTIKVAISGGMSFEAIVEKLHKALSEVASKDFIRLVIEGDIDPDVDLSIEEIKTRLAHNFYYVEVKNETQLDLDINQLAKDYKETLIGKYIEAMLELDSEDSVVTEALYKGLRLLLDEQVKL